MSTMNMDYDRTQPEARNIDNEIQQALSCFGSRAIEGQAQQKQATGSAVPIDPSITDGTNKDTTSSEFARSTAEAAVRSSQNNKQSSTNKVSKPRVNKPGQKFGAKKKSWVWSWFIQNEKDYNSATCDICEKVIKRLPSDKGSPKKLGEHLRTHKINKDSPSPRRDGILIHSEDGQRHYFNTLNQATESFKQHPLSHDTTEPPAEQQEQEEEQADLASSEFEHGEYSALRFQKYVMRFLVHNKLPLSIVQSQTFRQIIYHLKPSAVSHLDELSSMYGSLLDCIQAEMDAEPKSKEADNGNTVTTAAVAAATASAADEPTHESNNSNVDEQLTNEGTGEVWV